MDNDVFVFLKNLMICITIGIFILSSSKCEIARMCLEKDKDFVNGECVTPGTKVK